jgi:Escherichia/Staphylococcus phage prohead protease
MTAPRTFDRPFEVKNTTKKDGYGTFEGYGSVFGELDSYRDIVMPGAFTKTLGDFTSKGRRVPMLWQHRPGEPIGAYTEIKEDEHGLFVVGEINLEVQRGRETFALMQQKALSGLSIGYDTVRDEVDNKGIVRKLFEVNLWEISPVTFPAGDTARVQNVKELDTLSTIEDYLRDAGLSRNESIMIVSRIKAVIQQSESAAAKTDVTPSALKTALDNLRNGQKGTK